MLDKNGFKRKTYADLIEDMSNKARELFGEKINVSPRSPFGLIIMLFAWFLSLVWELAEKVYYSAYISKAEGVQLESLGANRGILKEPAAESYVDLSFRGQPGFTIPEQTQYFTETGIYFYLIEDVIINSAGDGTGRAVSVEKGIHTKVEANAITIQAEPMEEVTSVTNPTPAVGGRNEESESDYRYRLMTSTSAEGKATPPAIVSALSQISGVRSYNVIINNKKDDDEFGNPGKSVHVYVLGGDRQIIAETIFDAVAGGIETVGQEVVMIADLSGIEHAVRFDYAIEVRAQIQLSIQTNAAFPTDGEKRIKNNLIKHIGGTDTEGTDWSGYGMGQDVVYSQLFAKIYQVPGVEDVTLLVGREGSTLTNGNIVISPQEVAQTGVDLIEVLIT